MSAIDTMIGHAYELAVIAKHKPQAIDYLRQSLKEAPELLDEVRQRRSELQRVVAARSFGAICGCFVSKATLDLLTEALES